MQCDVLFFIVLSKSQKVQTAWNSKELDETCLECVAGSVEYFLCVVYEHIWLKYSCNGTFLSSSQTNSFEVRGKRMQTRPRLRPLLWARMWTLGSHSWSWKSNKWSFRWNREVQRLSVLEKWLKDKGSFDGFLGAWDDGTPLLKCHMGRFDVHGTVGGWWV